MLINIMILWADSASTWAAYFPVLPAEWDVQEDCLREQIFAQ
jgi:hypothetical protein